MSHVLLLIKVFQYFSSCADSISGLFKESHGPSQYALVYLFNLISCHFLLNLMLHLYKPTYIPEYYVLLDSYALEQTLLCQEYPLCVCVLPTWQFPVNASSLNPNAILWVQLLVLSPLEQWSYSFHIQHVFIEPMLYAWLLLGIWDRELNKNIKKFLLRGGAFCHNG